MFAKGRPGLEFARMQLQIEAGPAKILNCPFRLVTVCGGTFDAVASCPDRRAATIACGSLKYWNSTPSSCGYPRRKNFGLRTMLALTPCLNDLSTNAPVPSASVSHALSPFLISE